MNEKGLESDGYDLHHTIEDVDTSRDGGVDVEHTHGDGQGAVNEDEEDAKVDQEQVDAIVFCGRLLLVFKVLDLNEASHGGADAEEVDECVEHFAQVLKHRLLAGTASCGAEEDNQVQESEQEDEASWHRAHGGVGPVGLGQCGAQIGLPDHHNKEN